MAGAGMGGVLVNSLQGKQIVREKEVAVEDLRSAWHTQSPSTTPTGIFSEVVAEVAAPVQFISRVGAIWVVAEVAAGRVQSTQAAAEAGTAMAMEERELQVNQAQAVQAFSWEEVGVVMARAVRVVFRLVAVPAEARVLMGLRMPR